MVSSPFANSSTVLPALLQLTETYIYNLESIIGCGPLNYRTRTDLVGFDAGHFFVCSDCITNWLQLALEGALSDALSHLGNFDRFRYE